MHLAARIDGDGLAARCVAHLLKAGLQASDSGGRPPLDAVLLNTATQSLLADVFNQPGLFSGFHPIHRRIVAWGQNETTELPHAGVAVAERALLDRLPRPAAPSDFPEWRIVASRRHHPFPLEEQFGTRHAHISPVTLHDKAPDDVCWIESLPTGWLFLLATGEGNASLIAVGGNPEALLEQSHLITPHVSRVAPNAPTVPAYPRICPALCGPGWLACGSAAISFDPLCGEGAGHAVREAILASAVLTAIARGEPEELLLAHYSTRILSAFLRHLETCRTFYVSARSGPWWDGEIHLLDGGIAWCRSRLAAAPPYRYRLSGFELRPIEAGVPGGHGDER